MALLAVDYLSSPKKDPGGGGAGEGKKGPVQSFLLTGELDTPSRGELVAGLQGSQVHTYPHEGG